MRSGVFGAAAGGAGGAESNGAASTGGETGAPARPRPRVDGAFLAAGFFAAGATAGFAARAGSLFAGFAGAAFFFGSPLTLGGRLTRGGRVEALPPADRRPPLGLLARSPEGVLSWSRLPREREVIRRADPWSKRFVQCHRASVVGSGNESFPSRPDRFSEVDRSGTDRTIQERLRKLSRPRLRLPALTPNRP